MRHIAGQVALTVGALLGVVCVVSTIAVHVFGIAPLVVRSGSMEPTMPVGSLALAVPVRGPDLHQGDVVSVSEPDGGRVTHRVVSTAASSQVAVTAYLKGDANRHPDPAPYVIGSATRVVVVAPLAGYAVSWMQTPAGRVLTFLASLFLLYVGFRHKGSRRHRSIDDDSDHSGRLSRTVRRARPSTRNARYRARHASATGAVAVALSVALATQQVGTAHAAPLTDTATMVSSITAGTFGNSIPGARGAVTISTAPITSGCKISWTAPSSGFSVQVSFLPKGVAVPADHDPTPTTYQSQHTLTSNTLSYVATAPADVVGTDITSANGQIFTVRTVRTSDQLVSANFAYGYVYATTAGNYGCGVRSTDGTANYTWPNVSAGVQSFALKAAANSSTSSTAAAASASSSSAPSTIAGAASGSTSPTSTTPSASPATAGSTARSSSISPTTDSPTTDSTAADSTASGSTVTTAASGTTSPSSKVTASISGTTLTLTDTSSGTTLFTDTVQSGSTLAWAATDDILTVYQPDGTTVLVRRVGTSWQSEDVVSTPAAPSTTSSAPTSTTASTPAATAAESARSTGR